MAVNNLLILAHGNNPSSGGNPFAHVGKMAGAAAPDGLFAPAKEKVGATSPPSVKGPGTTTDRVELSGLAQALTGQAAAFFNQMDEKERGTLETLVKSGKVSVDDAVKGLQFWADEVTFTKAMTLVASTAQETDQARQRDDSQAAFAADFQEFAAISRENEARSEEYLKAVESGSGDVAAARERLDEVSARYRQASAKARQSNAAMGDTGLAIQTGFQQRFQAVADAKAASGHPDGGAPANADNKAAADRLAAAGLGQLDLKEARRRFAASITDFPY